MKKRLVLLSPSIGSVSETFIKSHRDRLPFAVKSLYRWRSPYRADDGRWIAVAPGTLRWLISHIGVSSFERRLDDWSDALVSKWLEDVGADAILAEYGPLGAGIASAAKKARIPLVVIFHGFDAYQQATLEKFRQRYICMFESAARIVVVSEPMKKQLVSLGAPAERIQVNPCGVDPKFFYGGRPGSSKRRFLYVGRFVGKKGPLQTIEAFAQVASRLSHCELEMIGDGPLLEASRARATALGVSESVKFTGAKSSQYVVNAMRSARALVQHSVRCKESGDQEGTPVSLIEAQMTGLPVVSTRHAGIPWVIEHGSTGLLVEEEDIPRMADAMVVLGVNEKLAGEMGAAARSRALEYHTIDRHISELAKTIESAL